MVSLALTGRPARSITVHRAPGQLGDKGGAAGTVVTGMGKREAKTCEKWWRPQKQQSNAVRAEQGSNIAKESGWG